MSEPIHSLTFTTDPFEFFATRKHVTDGTECWCCPRKEVYEDRVIVIHRDVNAPAEGNEE